MAGRVNHRGWIVIESAPSSDGHYCVDLFEDPDGGYGFEHFRAEPEDGGRFTPIGGYGATRFASLQAARSAAHAAVAWYVAPPCETGDE